MAKPQKRNNSYLLTASCGYGSNGKQIRKTKTWKPEPGMTEKQSQKEAERQQALFEEEVRTGRYLNGNIKFVDFIETWFKDYAETQLRPRTILAYKQLKDRTVVALGHWPIDRIQPQHLLEFYKNLAEPGIKTGAKYICTVDLKAHIKAKGIGINQFCELSQVADTTLRVAWSGQPIAEQTAKNICNALGLKLVQAFKPKDEDRVLSASTIGHYHSFISSVLERAVKWNLILSNPCRRIDPPKAEKKTPQYLNEHEAARMIELLQNEDEPHRTLFTLLIYSGMRRGEVMGLEWKDVNFDAGVISICRTSQHTKERGIFTDDVKNKSSHRSIRLPM
ncbi:MAG: tyrosine-type recombinase/integrase [Clostridiales bacterium]|nr:tyrosine-type recombinase/integrase [Clostridiales bacterium]